MCKWKYMRSEEVLTSMRNWVGGGRKKGDRKLYLYGKENGDAESHVPSLIICGILCWFMARYKVQLAAGSIRFWLISPNVSNLGITIGVLAWVRMVNNVNCQTNRGSCLSSLGATTGNCFKGRCLKAHSP